ncbi:MAG: hypothetical protein EBS53_10740, partial [Bacteroidetes bacterium]|nr:hypothetical protein [Bacteroidota bacterium]
MLRWKQVQNLIHGLSGVLPVIADCFGGSRFKTMNGFLFYRGASPIDRAPLIGIATLESENRKTGNMVQTWILREDISPTMARSIGEDRSFCGDCSVR